MKKIAITTVTFGALAAGALGLAGSAAAVPTGGQSAADVVKSFQDQGFNVQLNGTANVEDPTIPKRRLSCADRSVRRQGFEPRTR